MTADDLGEDGRWTTHLIPDEPEGAAIVGYVGTERGWLRLMSALLRAGYEQIEPITDTEGETE